MTLTPRAEPPAARELTASQLIVQLEEIVASLPTATGGPKAALAFDGDGTLWTGDVGEDVFHALLERGGLKAEVLAPLVAFAARYDIATQAADDSPAEQRAIQLARAVYRGYVAERVPERDICELMAWCFAGWSTVELRAFVGEVLRELPERRISESNHVLEWARGQGLRCVLISASPDAVVEVAGASYGFERGDVQGIRTVIDGDFVAPAIAGPTTYAEGKALVGASLLGPTPWLAAFGDSTFDAAMMQKAQVGVAVRGKPSLLRQLTAIPGSVRLVGSPPPPSPDRP